MFPSKIKERYQKENDVVNEIYQVLAQHNLDIGESIRYLQFTKEALEGYAKTIKLPQTDITTDDHTLLPVLRPLS